MNKNTTWTIIAVIALVLIAILAFSKPKTDVNIQGTNDTTNSPAPTDDAAGAPADTGTGMESGVSADVSVGVTTPGTPSFTINGGSFYFKPNTITVKQGDTVTITFKNDGGFHDLKIDGYNIATKRLSAAGQTDTITFTADKQGTFEYYCSVGEHRQMGMKGTLIVQ